MRYECLNSTFLIDPVSKRRSLIRVDQGLIDDGQKPFGKFELSIAHLNELKEVETTTLFGR